MLLLVQLWPSANKERDRKRGGDCTSTHLTVYHVSHGDTTPQNTTVLNVICTEKSIKKRTSTYTVYRK